MIPFALVLYAVGSLTAMAPMNISFACVALAWVYVLSKKQMGSPDDETKNTVSRYFKYTVFLSIACTISIAASYFWPYAYAGHNPSVNFHSFWKLWHLYTPFVLLSVFSYAFEHAQFRLSQFIQASWLGLCVLSIVAIIQFFTGWPHAQIVPTSPQFFHATLFFGHHLSTASIIIFPCFMALAVALGRKKIKPENHFLIKNLDAFAALAGVLILYFSFARTAWLTLPMGLALVFSKSFDKKKWIISGITILLLAFALSFSTAVQDRLSPKAGGVADRLQLWSINIDYFSHRPLTGIGFLKTNEMSEFYFKEHFPDSYRSKFWGHAHSNYFEMLGGTGLLGMIAYLAWVIFTVRCAYQISVRAKNTGFYFHSDLAWGIWAALIVLHINGLTNVNFWEGKVLHQHLLAIGILLMISFEVGRLQKLQNVSKTG
jgi:O-antigen ligase